MSSKEPGDFPELSLESERGPENTNSSQTRIDLAEDLLEKTAVLSAPDINALGPNLDLSFDLNTGFVNGTTEDQLHSAKILKSEGLLEEAKKLLHRILIRDSECVSAAQMLRDIHDEELRQIFSEDDRDARSVPGKRELRLVHKEESSEAVLSRLTADLGFDGYGDLDSMSLFQDRAALEAFSLKLDQDLCDLSAREQIDVGIAFLEMGLYDVAARRVRMALRDPQEYLAATALLATIQILSGHPIEAILILEPPVLDSDVTLEEKLALVYLMGLAYEKSGQTASALLWYEQVMRINAQYRDTRERYQKLSTG